MATMTIAFPILPGKMEQARQFAHQVQARSSEAAESFARLGVRREEWFLQTSPQGDMVLVTLESDDPRQTFEGWARSQDPFDRWFKDQAQQISGLDFNQPIPALPERVFAWPGS
ncbi:MAG TPA: DUF6176 family protein [Chthonomonadaceae bacterium]|nr:DUF6176 family protein [Chthonomonadaceae bacterium]